MRGPRLGALIGSIGGLVFVLVNAGSLAGPIAWSLRAIAVAAFAAVVVLVVRTGGRQADEPPPERRAWVIYVISVVAMVLAFGLGGVLLNRVLHRPELVLPWVVLVVGAHFLPFVAAFRAGIFRWLGWALMAIAVVGGVLAALVDPLAAPLTGVAAGLVLLGFAIGGLQVVARRPVSPAG